ncbi:MAG: TrkH family potassium uptake protein [Pirellulales bacterium]
MDYRLLSKYLGIEVMLLGAAMLFSIPWCFPALGGGERFETEACLALLVTVLISLLLGGAMIHWGRGVHERFFRKEAMATVGLSWVLAALLGALPFLLSRTYRADDVPMTIPDAIFESASGFSGTGATVITDLDNPELVPRAILFWRSETHFLGGLGIMVLFVAILGQGLAGKALFRAEMPGPSKETGRSRAQHAAWAFTSVYLGLNVVLTLMLMVEGMSIFDALCHSFGTIATGGFSTYDDSVAHFHSLSIEVTIEVFMVIACTNFTLLYLLALAKPGELLRDPEFRVYIGIIVLATALTIGWGMRHGDFVSFGEALRYTSFQVVSILTNTGFATHNFSEWNEFGRGLLFLLMFVGGCAGSTSCSVKVIRHMVFAKAMWLELERVYRPNVVRPLLIGGKPFGDVDLRRDVIVYFAFILFIFITTWLLLDALEPDAAWVVHGHARHEKLIDCASGIGATLNGVGPGLGTIGAVENYSHFQPTSKLLFVVLMLLGRLELYPLLVMLIPGFWRSG